MSVRIALFLQGACVLILLSLSLWSWRRGERDWAVVGLGLALLGGALVTYSLYLLYQLGSLPS